ncbi:MAG: type II toxin-antitoxin system death-on-curing family toxin [Promethearchaeota archaeon]
MFFLLREDIIKIHDDQISRYGGESGILLSDNLDLCATNYKNKLFGKKTFPGLINKAAALLRDIIKLHPFVDGNKRTAFQCANTFLKLNGYSIYTKGFEVIITTMTIASCEWEFDEATKWIQRYIQYRK